MVYLNDFHKETECIYKGEKYSVRDNGAVLRHVRDGKRSRPNDNQWTFGKPNNKGYMEIASVRIHRIVAIAFHGEPPTKEHIVDHIDTNRQNNRPENLRWVTKLENALNNPIIRKRIELICGSIEVFLKDPSILRAYSSEDPNFEWMKTVTPEEAQISWENLNNWTEKEINSNHSERGSLGEWIFNKNTQKNQSTETAIEYPDLITAKTLNAVQHDWAIPSEFPCCPQEYGKEPISAYVDKLKIGSIFCINDVYSSIVLKFAVSQDFQTLYVMSESTEEDATKPWGLAKITYENGFFLHTNLHTFFTKEGAEKQFCIAQGLEWFGGDSIDDYC